MKSRSTLKHIAEHLHLSISTVSRALKDHPDIAAHTKQKVRELAELLEYEPNAFAIQLRTNASKVIGVIVPEISGYFYHSFIAGLEDEARSWGYSLMILQSGNDPEVEAANLRLCRMNRAAGILVASTSGTKDLAPFERTDAAGIPVVFFDKVPESRQFPKVSMADAEAGFLGADTLIRKGRKRILALFGDHALSITRKRLKAFQGTFQRHAADGHLTIRHARCQQEARQITFEALADQTYDAVFAMSDEILAGAMKAIMQHRLRIPEDIGVLAISTGLIPGLYEPEISYIETSGETLGKRSFEILHKCMSKATPLGEFLVPSILVEKGSV
ncbi:MAG: LacI family DNA-binding transcriptional regulator [bacterium]